MAYSPKPIAGTQITQDQLEENFRLLAEFLGGSAYNAGAPYSVAHGALPYSLLDGVDITRDVLAEPYSILSLLYAMDTQLTGQEFRLWVPPSALLIRAQIVPDLGAHSISIGTTVGGQEIAATQLVSASEIALTANPYTLPASSVIYLHEQGIPSLNRFSLTLTVKVPVVA